jgi:S-adenosyl methyltransferase
MAGEPDWVPPGVDTARANVARVYDYWLGGSHNFLPDQDLARAIAAVEPNTRAMARARRIARLIGELHDQGHALGRKRPLSGMRELQRAEPDRQPQAAQPPARSPGFPRPARRLPGPALASRSSDPSPW